VDTLNLCAIYRVIGVLPNLILEWLLMPIHRLPRMLKFTGFMRLLLILTGLTFGPIPSLVCAQNFDQYTISTDDSIYSPNLATVTLRIAGAELSSPVYVLNSPDPLVLDFDELNSDIKAYTVKLLLCTRDWKPTDLMSSEYLSGFGDHLIEDYARSFNAQVPYVHYRAVIPNDDIRPTRSGNYILMVVDRDEDAVVLTRRMFVAEQRGEVVMDIFPTRVVEDSRYKQELSFTYKSPGELFDAYNRLSATVIQYRDHASAIKNLSPSFIRNNEYVFDTPGAISFNGNAEFRWVDTRSLRNNASNTQVLARNSNGEFITTLLPEEKRTFRVYESLRDIDGEFIAFAYDVLNPATEGDYVWVTFTLRLNAPMNESAPYVYGAISDWQLKDAYRMQWNLTKKEYTCTLRLKQGFYNYMYALKTVQGGADMATLEGSHSTTNNPYQTFVYYSDITAGSDRILYWHSATSGEIKKF
jgi:hypothetical protein